MKIADGPFFGVRPNPATDPRYLRFPAQISTRPCVRSRCQIEKPLRMQPKIGSGGRIALFGLTSTFVLLSLYDAGFDPLHASARLPRRLLHGESVMLGKPIAGESRSEAPQSLLRGTHLVEMIGAHQFTIQISCSLLPTENRGKKLDDWRYSHFKGALSGSLGK
jgi:hypothetical protein